MRRTIILLGFSLLTLLFSRCAFKGVTRYKNIVYQEANATSHVEAQQLNVFSPRHAKSPKNVFIFIHGGSWTSGKKSLYNFFGNRMARKDVVMVVIDYPLSPNAKYNDMAKSSALAVQWVRENIADYGGDPERIFVAGHSAGGHLAALITVQDKYFDSLQTTSPIKGTILIDAAGLDMCNFLKVVKADSSHNYYQTFTSDSLCWKDASPLYHLHNKLGPVPPMLIYTGERTYSPIISSNETFVKALKTVAPEPVYYVVKRKKHIPMITQFFKPWNPRYEEIINFMDNHGGKKLQAQNTASK